MLGSEMLDVAIGVVFIFFLVSIICSAVREWIESLLKSRAAYLEHGIRELLHDRAGAGIARALYEHPLVASLYAGGYRPGRIAPLPALLARGHELPSYIPSRNFALALLDIAARGPATDVVSSDPGAPALTLEAARANVLNLGSPHVQRVVLMAIDTAGGMDDARVALEEWYDSSMDRISGWYKRSTEHLLFIIGLTIAIGLNVNATAIVDYLYRNEAARSALATRAEAATQAPGADTMGYGAALRTLDSLDLPMGWEASRGAPRVRPAGIAADPWRNLIGPLLGWLVTALAATFGAPFWFDLLNKIMVVRSTVKPKEKSPDEYSEDRQRPVRAPAGQPATDGADASGGKAPVAAGVAAAGVAGAGVAGPGAEDTGAAAWRPAPRPVPRDSDSRIDACDADFADAETVTADEDLPEAEGGVA